MTKPKRCNNNEMSKFTTYRQEFKNNNGSAYGTWYWDDKVYAVFSYGPHFPMYVYDSDTEQWYGNKHKYSRTTSCHQNYARPQADIQWMDTEGLQRLILCRGVVGAVTHRIATAIAQKYEPMNTAA